MVKRLDHRSLISYIIVFILALAIGIWIGVLSVKLPSASTPKAIFSPDNGEEVINFINSAKTSLDIEMYVMTSDEAMEAILAAKDRGVKVRVILEKGVMGSDNEEPYNKLSAAGVPVRWAPDKFALLHAKFIIVDGKMVLIGSHNLTNNALKKNREASVILDGSIVQDFLNVFEKDWNT
jgi:phosphatidylserine/phosphatidylglycerophosphate/cardiolipin synthase-like enzyme